MYLKSMLQREKNYAYETYLNKLVFIVILPKKQYLRFFTLKVLRIFIVG